MILLTYTADTQAEGVGRFSGTDQLIVQFSDNKQFPSSRVAELGKKVGWKLKYLRAGGKKSHVIKVTGMKSLRAMKQLAAQLSQQQGVLYAEPDRILHPIAYPDDTSDTHYSLQWHYYESIGGIAAPAAWSESTGSGINVAVIDTGYRPHHDLLGNLITDGYDMIADPFVANEYIDDGRDSDAADPGDWVSKGECGGGYPTVDYNSSWHGTHVAGTVAATTNNSLGVAGVAPDARILPVRVLGKCGGYTSDITDGMLWAAGLDVPEASFNSNPARVLNLSLGGGGACSRTMQNTINSVRGSGAVVIVAAGNSAMDIRGFTPANCKNVVTVAATTREGSRAWYSNYGRGVDLSAPGGDTSVEGENGVLSTYNSGKTDPAPSGDDTGDTYAYYQGTSMATPHVAGVAALMLSVKPELTPGDVENLLKSSARAFPKSCSKCGTGILNAGDAVAAAQAFTGGDGGDSGDGGDKCRGGPKKCPR
ncbi:MAG: S8 family peptidase [Candidatus Sedimenticola sp. (ex Thyasira tokunagai)]